MTKIIQFNKQPEEQHSCPTCDLVLSYIDEIADSESPEELFELLSELVEEAKDLGVASYLAAEIDSKIELFEHLTGECGCEEEE